MSRSRNYCFTLNNYTDLEVADLARAECKWLGYGKEVGENLTPHLQGLVCFATMKSLAQVKKLPGFARAHLEKMRGSFEQAKTYCAKDGQFEERGEPPMTQGQKGDANVERFDDARKAAEEGRFEDIPSDIYMRMDNACHRIHARAIQNLDTLDGPMEHEWWYGRPGTGKSRKAREEHPDAYVKDPCERWWDGYKGQEVVIIDDFDKYQKAQGGDMKRWLDRYSFKAPVKGGYLDVRPRKIIVTSNYHPDTIWDDEVTQAAIGRRVKIVRFGDGPFRAPVVDNGGPLAPTFRPLVRNA